MVMMGIVGVMDVSTRYWWSRFAVVVAAVVIMGMSAATAPLAALGAAAVFVSAARALGPAFGMMIVRVVMFPAAAAAALFVMIVMIVMMVGHDLSFSFAPVHRGSEARMRKNGSQVDPFPTASADRISKA